MAWSAAPKKKKKGKKKKEEEEEGEERGRGGGGRRRSRSCMSQDATMLLARFIISVCHLIIMSSIEAYLASLY